MIRLTAGPPLMADEPLLSFASRIARCYGTDLMMLCHELGISRRELASGTGTAPHHLAALTGLDAAVLYDRAFAWEGGVWRFKGQALHRLGVRRRALIVCPRCLRDDGAGIRLKPDQAAYVRAHWLVKAVRTCVEHGVELVEVVEPELPLGAAIHDFAKRLAPSLGDLGTLSDRARQRTPTDLERYVVDRLHGKPVAGGLADAMPLYAAARSCEMLGAAALFGPKTHMRPLDQDAWRAAGSVGFDVASLGMEAVTACLTNLMDSHGTANKNTGPNKVFGRLYSWLKTDESGPDYDPLRDLLREVIFETIPLAAGTEVLGVALDRRRVHSLHSATVETGRGSKGLRRELRAVGVLPVEDGKGPGRLIAISVDQTNEALAELARSLPRAKAADHIGAIVPDLKVLVKAGLIGTLVPRPDPRRSHVRFSIPVLDAFLAEMMRGVTGVAPPGARMRDIPTAAKLSNRGLANVTSAVMGRRLRHVARLPGTRGYRSILVDVDEVLNAPVMHDGGLGVDDLAQRLRVTRFTALELVKAGHVVAHAATSRMGRRTITVVNEGSVSEFASTFVSLSELSKLLGVGWTRLKQLIEADGASPAFPGDRMRSVIYRRRDVASIVARLGPDDPTP